MAGLSMAEANTLDTGFLTPGDPDRQASLAIGAVAVVDGAVPDYESLKRVLLERIQSIPRCTQVLRIHPFNGARQWIDDPGFDLRRHVRRLAILRPGDDAELSRAIAHALERPLDLDVPLWECWIIEGLKGNQWAILIKVHNYLADGISAAQLLTRLCDEADSDIFANHVGSKQISSQSQKRGWADALWRASALAGTVTSNLATAIWPAASSTTPVTTKRRYRTVRVPLAAVDDVCGKFRVSANDVALAAIAEGFRTVLLHRGEQPRADSLRTLEKADNRIPVMLPYLPVEHDDPVQRLRTVHNRLNQPSRGVRRQAPGILDLATAYPPFMLCAKIFQTVLSRLPQPGIVTLATNAPGPRHRLGLMGKKVQRLLPIPPTAMQLSTGVAVLSYGDELVFGITAAYDAGPELEQLAAGIERGMARLVALSDDSVLLFTKDRRKRASRAVPSRVQRGRPSPPAGVRH
jgi:diacylglycerol O-acyltransferase